MMENLIEMHEEEVVAPEPYKFNPDPQQPGLEGDEQDDAGYTLGETEFADGEGTELNQEIDEMVEDEDDEDSRNSALGHS